MGKKIRQHPNLQTDSFSQQQKSSYYEPGAPEVAFSVKPSLPPSIHLFKSQVILNPTISKINFVGYLIYSAYLSLVLVPVGLLSLPLLKIVFGLSTPAALDAETILQVCTLTCKIILYPFFGAWCDKYGRKLFIIIGVILMNAGVFVTPNVPDIYPCFILASVLLEIGLLCLSVPPLLADYIDYETKGRVAGITGVIGSLASFVSTYITSLFNVQDGIPSEYHFIALGGLAIGVVIILALKGGPYHKALYYDQKAEEAKQKAAEMIQEEKRRQSEDHGSQSRKESINQDIENALLTNNDTNHLPQSLVTENNVLQEEAPGLKAGIKEAQRNPWILLGYLGSFLNMAIIVIINGILVNYVPAITGNQDDTNQAYDLASKQVLAALVSTFFFGYALDKWDKFNIFVSTVVLSIVSVPLLLLAPSPYNFTAYLSMVCFGISSAGMGTFTSQVLSKYPDPKYRASVGAVGGICSILGQVWGSLVGMVLSQFDPRIPFYLYFGAAIVVGFFIIRIYMKNRDSMSKV